MIALDAVPAWAALLVAVLALGGAAITLIGTAGLLRLDDFYARCHAPTLGATLGTGGALLASMLYFTVLNGRPSVHEVLIAVFVTITTPVTLMMLARAALYRDRVEGEPQGAAPATDTESS